MTTTSLVKRLLFSVLLAASFVTISCADQKETAEIIIPDYAHVYSTESSFKDAKEDLLDAIGNSGMVVSYTSHAKTMLDNTAAVSGVTKSVYANAEILSFCKADLSHDLVKANPHNIVLCPYNIAIYVLNAEPKKVYFSFRQMEASEPSTKPIQALLISIIKEAL